jgi:Ca2+-binding RTX toxin-like protein
MFRLLNKIFTVWTNHLLNSDRSIGSENDRKDYASGKRHNGRFDYQRLEVRQVLTGFNLDAGGTLWVSGSEGPDTMLATIENPVGSMQPMVQVTMNNLFFFRPVSQVRELVFIGRGGDDIITNETSIPSRMFGGPGNDILTGGFGNDLLAGGRGDDILNGRAGDDVLIGGIGNNTLDGGAGNDRLFGGYGGHNVIRGGSGNDMIFAGDLGDEIYGGLGNNQIYGNQGPDRIFAGPGRNTIMGNGGDDVIIVEGDNNFISGGSGNDSIFVQGNNNTIRGGMGHDGLMAQGSNNRLLPGLGNNRILVPPGQAVPQHSTNNVAVRFINRSSQWTLHEMEAVDRGLRALHHRTGGTMVLRDTTSQQPLTFAKYAADDAGLAGQTTLNSLTGNFSFSATGAVSAVYQREIRVADFDPNHSQQVRMLGMSIVKEIAHNWDSNYEINQRLPGRGNLWPEFAAISSWRTVNPGAGFVRGQTSTREPFEFQVIGNNNVQIPVREWWYRSNSAFANSDARANAKSDWAATWQYIFMEPVFGSALPGFNSVLPKITKVNQLLDLMG